MATRDRKSGRRSGGGRPAPAVHTRLPLSPDRRRVAITALLLAAVTIAAYAPVWDFDFVALDDPGYVYANPRVSGGVSLENLRWALTTGHEANWHPLTWISHQIDVSLFGVRSGPHHVVNLALHVAGTLLLFGVLRRLTRSHWRSAFVAAVFALHPLHVESVAWIAERKDVLSAFFFMLTLLAYARYVESPARRRFAAVFGALALGLMSKPMLVTTPFVLLLLDYWPLGRIGGGPVAGRAPVGLRSAIVEKLPLFALVAASSVVTYIAQSSAGATRPLEAIPLALRAQNALVSYGEYLRATFWPADLGVFYPFPATLPMGRVAAAAAVLIVISAAVVSLRRRAPFLVTGWAWFLGMLVPVIGIVQVGGQARADRYAYLPMIGLAVAVAWGSVALARAAAARRVVAAIGAATLLAAALVTNRQVQHWRNTVTLWSHTARVTEGTANFGVYFGLAEYLRANGRAPEAIAWYEGALARNPKYMEAYSGLAAALVATGESARAADVLARAVDADPEASDLRLALGMLLSDLGHTEAALVHLQAAVRLNPDAADRHWRLALALATASRVADAVAAFAEAVRLEPAVAVYRADHGWALAQAGQIDAGIRELREAVRLDPASVQARHNLGRLLTAHGQAADAVSHLRDAVRLAPDALDVRVSLARALVVSGQRNEAIAELRGVLTRAPDHTAARALLGAIERQR